MNFSERLRKAVRKSGSCLCVGLDPDLARIPESVSNEYKMRPEQVASFLKTVIDQTRDHCAAYKPNLGFFEALGASGLEVFQDVINYIPDGKIVVADVKRGDISSTAKHYAKAYFETFDVDAITINPMMGFESLQPFLDYPGKGVYTLTLTSNPGARDFLMIPFEGYDTMAAYIAHNLAQLQENHATSLGMVVGATKAENLADVLQQHPQGDLLIPGIGAQGGSIPELEKVLSGHKGVPLVNSSRSIIYAGEGTGEWKQAISDASRKLKQALTSITDKYAS
jgi:orotidine-5'-phosphate decarboxylase